MRVRWSRSLSVEGCMVGVDVVVQDVVAAGVVGRFGGGCPMLVVVQRPKLQKKFRFSLKQTTWVLHYGLKVCIPDLDSACCHLQS